MNVKTKRTKSYVATYQMWRESFRGSDYQDGEKQIFVDAINDKAARRKADRELAKHCSKGWSQSIWGTFKSLGLKGPS